MPMMLKKFGFNTQSTLRDARPLSVQITEALLRPSSVVMVSIGLTALFVNYLPYFTCNLDFLALGAWMYFRWLFKKPFQLPFKFPKYANLPDRHNQPPGTGKMGKSEGILYFGNVTERNAAGLEGKRHEEEFGRELWLTNSDARTHILYIGTTGSGKTEGLKGLVTNALAWGSGFVYVDGKADTDLWASLYALARRFGRDDDLFVLNYMTGNSDNGSTSNTFNPFSTGSSSYLANMIVSFMPDAGGDNAMWKERAVALMFALMPALVYRRDFQGLLLDIGVVRDNIELKPIIRMARDPSMPERITHALQGYLNTLPGYIDAAFDDEGNERPPSPDQPMYDLQVARQQHGYLSMQFTRPLQMMADEYGYIFKAQLADVDILDIVLNRRMLVVLVPALEKSGPEAANLGKIVAASLKGMMGATLGNAVEGSWETAVGSKQTRSQNSFMTVFDEVGYYTAPGMAVMAAQARSLGFSLVFASQDLPSMSKQIKQEAQSILANCNTKIFGKIEDPTETADFLKKHAGGAYGMQSSGFSSPMTTTASLFHSLPLYEDRKAAFKEASRLDYDHMRDLNEGEAHIFFAHHLFRARMFYAAAEKVKALRVHRLLPVPGTTSSTAARERAMNELTAHLKDGEWTAAAAAAPVAASMEIAKLVETLAAVDPQRGLVVAGALAVASIATLPAPVKTETQTGKAPKQVAGNGKAAAAQGQMVTVSDLVAKGQNRTSLPPLYEGDQYAIGDIEAMPMMATQAVAPATLGMPAGVPIGISESMPGAVGVAPPTYAPMATDLGVVTHPDFGEDEINVLEIQLPVEIAAMIEQSAKKLNKGLNKGGEAR